MAITDEQRQEVRRLNGEGILPAEIAGRLGVCVQSVCRAIDLRKPPTSVKRAEILPEHRRFILAKLELYPELSAQRLFEVLKERGYAGSCDAVRKYVSAVRPLIEPPSYAVVSGKAKRRHAPKSLARPPASCAQESPRPGGQFIELEGDAPETPSGAPEGSGGLD